MTRPSASDVSAGQALASVRRGGRLLQVGIPTDAVSLQLSAVALYEKEIAGTNGQRCLVDLPEALDLLAHTDLASSIGYRAIPLESLVEEGLRPLVEHRAEESRSNFVA